jgi:hypothetical protein
VTAWTVVGALTVWQTDKINHPRKKRYPMKKIVIISEQGQANHRLIAFNYSRSKRRNIVALKLLTNN